MFKNSIDDISLGNSDTVHESAAITRIIHEFSVSFGTAIDFKDHCTKSHSEEVAEVSRLLAARCGLGSGDVNTIHIAGHLHDVGKIGVPDRVLRKTGPLNPDEWGLMARHPSLGARIVSPVAVLAEAGIPPLVLHHHERWDGCGYPYGLKGRDIPLGARIIAVADTLSAMMQKRPYRAALTFKEASDEIHRCAGTQFEPEIVSVFGSMEKELEHAMEDMSGIREAESPTGELEPPDQVFRLCGLSTA